MFSDDDPNQVTLSLNSPLDFNLNPNELRELMAKNQELIREAELNPSADLSKIKA